MTEFARLRAKGTGLAFLAMAYVTTLFARTNTNHLKLTKYTTLRAGPKQAAELSGTAKASLQPATGGELCASSLAGSATVRGDVRTRDLTESRRGGTYRVRHEAWG